MITGASFGTERRGAYRWAILFAALGITGCAEIEVGASAIKAVNRSINAQAAPLSALPAARQQITQSAAAQAITPGPNAKIDARMRPVPEEFEAAGAAKWDGSRTLQGIWVAHPSARTARRVRIVNETNGYAVDGALFRRDETGRGPTVIVSSDAAEALGMTPNEEVSLSIVAIKRGAAIAPQTVTASDIPTEETETAQVPAVPEPAAEPVAKTPLPEPQPEVAAVEPAPQPEPKAKEEPAFKFVDPEPAPKPEPKSKDEPAFKFVEPEPAPKPEPEIAPAPKPEPETQMAVVEPAKVEPAMTQSAGKIADGKPYVQAGIFGVKENADRLIRKIEDAGFPATGKPLTSNGRELTRVISGPFESQSERDAALGAIRKLGPKDATPVRR